MNPINSQGHSLLDYINDPDMAKQQLKSLGEARSQSQEIGEDLTALTGDLSSDELSRLAEKIQAGETSVSAQRLKNMVGFYSQSVHAELDQQLTRFDLEQHDVIIKQQDGQWQLTADDTVPEQNLERLQRYLNKDDRLATRMEQLSQLSSLSEWTQLQQGASTMKEDGVDEDQLLAMLTKGRDAIMNTRHFIGQADKGVSLASTGLSGQMLNAIKED